MEMERAEIASKDEASRLRVAIRCAKAAMLLSTLKSFPNRHSEIPVEGQDKESKRLRRAIGVLKLELAKERIKNKRIKQCATGEFILLIMAVIFLSNFFVVILFSYSLMYEDA